MRQLLLIVILFRPAIAAWPDRYHSGERLLKQGKIQEALQELNTALHEADAAHDEGKGLAAILDAIGRAEFRGGRYRNAKRHFERAAQLLEDQPQSRPAVLANAGQACLAVGKFASAEHFFRAALELLPGHAGLWQLLGKALFLQNRQAEAERAQRKALALAGGTDPNIAAVASNDLAILYQSRNNHHEAVDLLLAALSATPHGQGRARMLANLGVSHWKIGNKQEAATYLRQGLAEMEAAVGPEHPDVERILADYHEVLQKTGKKGQAREIAKRAAAMRSAFAAQTNSRGSTVDWRDLK
jgi:tetratricopeptide (TPR) repeat protein